MMVEDKEIRDIFKVESADRLTRIMDGLLILDKDPSNMVVIEDIFREAHSLKGAARMIGLTEVETISHVFEDILGGIKKSGTSIKPEIIDRLYKGVDTIRELINEAATGEPANVSIPEIIEHLKSEKELPKVEPEKQAEIKPEIKTDIKTDIEKFQIDTIRINTSVLDILMSGIGELTVSKIRVSSRLTEVDKIIELWEQLKKHNDMELIDSIGNLLNKFRSAASDDTSRLELIANKLEEEVRSMRLLPMSTIFNLFPRMVRDISKQKGKEVDLIIDGGSTFADKGIIEEMKSPIMHMIRNAIDHGIELPEERLKKGKFRTGIVLLKGSQTPTNIVIEVSDDGKGIDIEEIKRTALKRKLFNEDELAVMNQNQIQSLIFMSGFSTSSFVTDVSGRGIGLDVVRANIERLKGNIEIDSKPNIGCTIKILLPITLATARVFIISIDKIFYAIPVESIKTNSLIHKKDIFTIEGRETIIHEDKPVSIVKLSELLQLNKLKTEDEHSDSKAEVFPCIIIFSGPETLALIVDEVIEEQEIVLKPQGRILKRVRNIIGATILGTGEVCMVLNPHDLIRTVRKKEISLIAGKHEEEQESKKIILMAEDSITTRTQVKRILEGAGYDVVAAVDGLDAYNKLNSRPFDAIISDINMPNMDGLTLAAKVRENKNYKEMPIILVTSLSSEEDKKRGIEAGANAYITKPSFDQKTLLDTLKRLV
ncbi:MAG: hybrid sensor histidine kinase/response regulator [Desulfobacterales bacterium]|nr:hybrid sensor histidine kinase/response regulator [Desulfobacterales bacterium]